MKGFPQIKSQKTRRLQEENCTRVSNCSGHLVYKLYRLLYQCAEESLEWCSGQKKRPGKPVNSSFSKTISCIKKGSKVPNLDPFKLLSRIDIQNTISFENDIQTVTFLSLRRVSIHCLDTAFVLRWVFNSSICWSIATMRRTSLLWQDIIGHHTLMGFRGILFTLEFQYKSNIFLKQLYFI